MPRAGLTPEKVTLEAARIADELGWDGLSLATVAERVGVKLPSLYKHVASLAAMREAVAALSTRELAERLTRAAVGRAGPAALRSVAEAYRAFARQHPGRYAATVRAPRPDNAGHVEAAAATMRVVVAILEGYGLTGRDAVHAVRALRSALHGFVSLEASGGFGLPEDVDRSFRLLVDALDATFSAWPKRGAGAKVRPKARA